MEYWSSIVKGSIHGLGYWNGTALFRGLEWNTSPSLFLYDYIVYTISSHERKQKPNVI